MSKFASSTRQGKPLGAVRPRDRLTALSVGVESISYLSSVLETQLYALRQAVAGSGTPTSENLARLIAAEEAALSGLGRALDLRLATLYRVLGDGVVEPNSAAAERAP
jgi:hypothetical protein